MFPSLTRRLYPSNGLHGVQSNSGPMIRKDSPNYESGQAADIFASDSHGNPVVCGC